MFIVFKFILQNPKTPQGLYDVIGDRLQYFYYDTKDNGDNTTKYERKFTTRLEGYRLGSPKLIQSRVLPGTQLLGIASSL